MSQSRALQTSPDRVCRTAQNKKCCVKFMCFCLAAIFQCTLFLDFLVRVLFLAYHSCPASLDSPRCSQIFPDVICVLPEVLGSSDPLVINCNFGAALGALHSSSYFSLEINISLRSSGHVRWAQLESRQRHANIMSNAGRPMT